MTSRLLIGTADGIRRLGSDAVELAGHSITALAGGWALKDGRGLWRLGGPEGPVLEAEIDALPPGTCLLPIDGSFLIGTAEAHMARVEQAGVTTIEDFEHAEGRQTWHTPWGGPPDVRSLAAGQGAVYANVHVGGILVSFDQGASWTPTTLDIDTDVHQVLATEQVVLAALGNAGLARSHDQGRTWMVTTRGLHAGYCRAVAASEDTVLLSASTGPRGGRAALYRGSISGDDFERCDGALPGWFSGNIDTGRLVLDGSDAAFATADGRVFVSDDAGVSWVLAAEELPPVTALQLQDEW